MPNNGVENVKCLFGLKVVVSELVGIEMHCLGNFKEDRVIEKHILEYLQFCNIIVIILVVKTLRCG